MQEELVTFQVAKLAKEKGFDLKVKNWFDTSKNPCFEWESSITKDFNNGRINQVSRPTQALLQRWLREVHNIDVYCIPWVYENKRVYDFYINYEGESRAYSSYEEALEVGLQETLKLIKNE